MIWWEPAPLKPPNLSLYIETCHRIVFLQIPVSLPLSLKTKIPNRQSENFIRKADKHLVYMVASFLHSWYYINRSGDCCPLTWALERKSSAPFTKFAKDIKEAKWVYVYMRQVVETIRPHSTVYYRMWKNQLVSLFSAKINASIWTSIVHNVYPTRHLREVNRGGPLVNSLWIWFSSPWHQTIGLLITSSFLMLKSMCLWTLLSVPVSSDSAFPSTQQQQSLMCPRAFVYSWAGDIPDSDPGSFLLDPALSCVPFLLKSPS